MDADQAKGTICSQPGLSELFPTYIDGDLGDEEQEGIEEHLAECVECQENLRFFLDLQKVGRELFRTE